jgi:hypothetical protein
MPGRIIAEAMRYGDLRCAALPRLRLRFLKLWHFNQ